MLAAKSSLPLVPKTFLWFKLLKFCKVNKIYEKESKSYAKPRAKK